MFPGLPPCPDAPDWLLRFDSLTEDYEWLSALRGWACERAISLRWRSTHTQHPDFEHQEDRDRQLCEVMLSNRVSLAELAEHFNLTREGVRQVALRWGVYDRRPALR